MELRYLRCVVAEFFLAVVIWSCGYKLVGYMVFGGLCCNVEVLVVWFAGMAQVTTEVGAAAWTVRDARLELWRIIG